MTFAHMEKLADAVLYEGYALYPYRAASAKNRVRFQWGVLVPPEYLKSDPSERTSSRTEVVLDGPASGSLSIRVRFLHLTQRLLLAENATGDFEPVDEIDLGEKVIQNWDESAEFTIDLKPTVEELLEWPLVHRFSTGEGSSREEIEIPGAGRGRIERRTHPVSGTVEVRCEQLPGPHGAARLRVTIDNTTATDPIPDRDQALRHAMVGCHVMLARSTGRFFSQIDPPEFARPYVDSCENDGTFPVLVDDSAASMLSSPIILYDNPEIAPESPDNLFDGLEIDEILTLRTMTLTDEEKRLARGTEDRTASIIDHADFIPQEMLDKLHGAIRNLGPVATKPDDQADIMKPDVPWWDPGADASVSPETDSVNISGVTVARGSKVRLEPRLQRADAQDMFLKGKVANVEAVLYDVDGNVHLAVGLEDDPGYDMMQVHGRYLYFSSDEVVPVGSKS